jgi:hypothetical protein
MSVTMCTLFSVLPLGILFITGSLGERGEIGLAAWRPLALCWLIFIVSHVIGFITSARQGAYRELISDRRVNVLVLRYLPLVVGAIGAAGEPNGYPVAPWFFVVVLAIMAVVDTVTYLVDLEEDESALRKVGSRAGSTP